VRRLALLIALLGGLAFARVTWYYDVDQGNAFTPATLDFNPSAADLACAALLEPGAAPAGAVTLANIAPPAGCPQTPPLVVYAVDPDSGDTVYAALLTVKFWGRKRANNGTYGTRPLINLIKNSYALSVTASGDLDDVDDQFHPPFTRPPQNAPVSTGDWYAWRSSQTISLADPQVSDVQNHGFWNRTCRDLYNDRCWSAVFTWALPVRLQVHGGEKGGYQITLTPGYFERKTASTLSVREGEFSFPELKAYGR